jgi:hypothetical protein
MIHQSDEVVDKEFNGIMTGADFAFSVTPYIVGDDPISAGEGFRLTTGKGPHAVAEGKSVDKNDRYRIWYADIDVPVEEIINHRFHADSPVKNERKQLFALVVGLLFPF